MHHGALEGKIFACTLKALERQVTHSRVKTYNGTTLLCAYWDSVERGNVTDRDMRFHMKFAAAKLGYPSRNIPLDRIDIHSNRIDGACAMKLAGFDDESIRKWEDGCRCRMIFWNTFNISYRGSLKVCQPK